jgi:hypothetical protein
MSLLSWVVYLSGFVVAAILVSIAWGAAEDCTPLQSGVPKTVSSEGDSKNLQKQLAEETNRSAKQRTRHIATSTGQELSPLPPRTGNLPVLDQD